MVSSKFKYNIYISIFLGLFLLFNFGLTVTDSPLCKSQGCELAGSIINIDKSYLYLFGSLFSLFLSGLAFKGVEFNSNKSLYLFKFFILSAFVFESIMFLSLIKLKSEVCVVCLVTYISIITMFLLSFKLKESLLTIMTFIFPLGLALSILSLTSSNKIFDKNERILFQSETCSHCKNIKEFLEKENISYQKKEADIEFLTSLNIQTVPVLIEKTNNKIVILEGEKEIKNHFSKNENILFNSNSFISFENDSEGCSLTKKDCND